MNSTEHAMSGVSELLDLPPFPAARSAASKIRDELDEILST